MTALNTLKAQLEPFVNQKDLSEDFKAAISDGIYATTLSQAALEQWIGLWVSPRSIECTTEADIEYCKGVRLVEQQWEAITGMF